MTKDLLFIDTNILLDFYRVRHEAGLKLLHALDGIHDRLITTYQVEMEFKRNRHAAIAESLKTLKDRDAVPHAAFLAGTRSAEALDKRIRGANAAISGFRDRLVKVLANPTRHDPVYRVVQRLFTHATALNLKRDNPIRRTIKRQAFRRFVLGYPPRKSGDTSMGDALNWEWIVKVAQDTGSHILVVSRDSDYGIEHAGRQYINDWLLQEFRDRVSKKRQLVLFTRLAPALKRASVTVTKEAEREEEELTQRREAVSPTLWPDIGAQGWIKRFEEIIERTQAKKPTAEG
jgi:predicted nucleic acid-binding protein